MRSPLTHPGWTSIRANESRSLPNSLILATTPWILSVAALGELVNDKLPKTPSRKTPPQFVARVLFGSVTGGAIGIASGMIVFGVILGALGAVAGTLIGAWARGALVRATGGKDLPIALLEDATAIGLSILLLYVF